MADYMSKNSNLEEELINLVKNYPVIWDVRDPGYKSRSLRRNYFQSITLKSKTMFPNIGDISIESVQSKWKNLRTYFNNQLKKQRNMCSGMSSNDTYISKWEHFNSLMFLKNSFEMTEAKDNLTNNENDVHSLIEIDNMLPVEPAAFELYSIVESNKDYSENCEHLLNLPQNKRIQSLRSDDDGSSSVEVESVINSTPSLKKMGNMTKKKNSKRLPLLWRKNI